MAATNMPIENEIVIFTSTHHLIHAEYKLKKSNVPITLYPVPPEFKEMCLTAITFPAQFKGEVEKILKGNQIEIKGIYPFDTSKLQRTEELVKAKVEETSDAVFLKRILLQKVEMCIADPDKIRIFADFSDDVSEILPYLNSKLPNASYNDDGPTLTFMRGPTLITIYGKKIAAAKVDDENGAVLLLEWIRDLVNETFENKDSIEASCKRTVRLNPIELYKYLPKTNCEQCGELTCLAFAVGVLSGEAEIAQCSPLLQPEFAENNEALYQLLDALGF